MQNTNAELEKVHNDGYFTVGRWSQLNSSDNKPVSVNAISLSEDKNYTMDQEKIYTNMVNYESNSDLIISDTSVDSVKSIESHRNNENNSFQKRSNVYPNQSCPCFAPKINDTEECKSLSSKINVSFGYNTIQPCWKNDIFQVVSDILLPSFELGVNETNTINSPECVNDLLQECLTTENLETVSKEVLQLKSFLCI